MGLPAVKQATPTSTKWGAFSVLSIAHLVNDMYANFLPPLLPFLLADRGFSLAAGANLVAAFSMTSSIMQPLFGYIVDLKNLRWLLGAGVLVMALLLGLTGFISSYPVLLAVCALAGLGSAVFHPQASAMVGGLGGNRKGFILAAFVTAGNIGLALSPALLLPLFNAYGIRASWITVLPGLLAALLLHFMAPAGDNRTKTVASLSKVMAALKEASGELGKLMLVVTIRSLVHTGLLTLLPLYFLAKNFSPEVTGTLMFGTLTIGAFGGIIGGYISDRYGRKPLIIGSLALSSVFFYGFLSLSGVLSYIMLALGGVCLLGSFSVTVAAAQEIIPENKALASGLSLGFAFGMGGLAVSPLGKYAQVYGVEAAVHLVFALPVAAALIGLSLKRESRT